MQIHYLSPVGVLPVEQAAFKRLEKELPAHWVAFAAFQLVVQGSAPLDIDLLILTDNRIIVTELKNWRGEVISHAGQWIHNGRPQRSPVDVTTEKHRKLFTALKQALPRPAVPYVEPLVVMCHENCQLTLSQAEKQYVMTLPELCRLSDGDRYRSRYPDTPNGGTRPSANPLNELQRYQLFFSPMSKHIRAIRFSLHGYLQDTELPEYQHPAKLFAEHNATHRDQPMLKGMLRKWDFSKLEGGNTTAMQRANIALRELRVNEYVRTHSEDLHRALLEPIGSATAEDVTTNFAELYRLPRKVERFASFVNRRLPTLPLTERIAIAKSVLVRFAEMHKLGIAHRDIGTHSLWLEEPARIAVSCFGAAYFPERETVGPLRVGVEAGQARLPEDDQGDAKGTPFHRDVYLLGRIVYHLITGISLKAGSDITEALGRVGTNGELLSAWLGTALALSPTERFHDAGKALDALNRVTGAGRPSSITLADFDPFRTSASAAEFPVVEPISMKDGKWVYRSERSGQPCVVKVWTALRYDDKRPTQNARLLHFLETARSMQNAPSGDYARVIESGVGPMGLILVVSWVEGLRLDSWMEKVSQSDLRGQVALELLKLTQRLHAAGFTHGDIKPENLIVRAAPGEESELTVLDLPDIQSDGRDGFTPAYRPANVSSDLAAPAAAATAALLVVRELLSASAPKFPLALEEVERALTEASGDPPLELIQEVLSKELLPPVPEALLNFVVRHVGGASSEDGRLPSDNDRYFVGVTKDKNSPTGVVFFLSGLRHQLLLHVDVASGRLSRLSIREHGHVEYVRSVARATFFFKGSIRVVWGATDDAAALVEYLVHRAREEEVLLVTGAESEQPLTDAEKASAAQEAPAIAEMWRRMSELEEENATTVTLRAGGVADPEDASRLLIPYDLDAGTLDFRDDEEVNVLGPVFDISSGETRWRPVAKLNVRRSNAAVLAVEERRFSFRPDEGQTYRLRSRLEEIALERRQVAMERVLEGRALIANLPAYFEGKAGGIAPSEIALPITPDLSKYALNDEQEASLSLFLRRGPVCLLQGPPGTGKTKFIAAFIHCVLSNQLAKNILVVSQSHEAINHALAKVAELNDGDTPFSIVRVGQENMLSDAVRDLHDLAQQQRYREQFAAEIKERIRVAARPLGIPDEYVEEFVELELNLGILKDRLNSARAALSEAKEEQLVSELRKKASTLLATFESIALSRYDQRVDGDDHGAAYDAIRAAMTERHEVQSPASERRLEELVRLSIEFKDVLGNPRANFTAFLARSSQVVAGTCVGIGRHSLGIVDHAYDWVIVDEAARSSSTELVVAMQAGRRVLLVGDHKQLPPTYTPDFERELAKALGKRRLIAAELSDFARAFESEYGAACGRRLQIQYRMGQDIAELVSNCFYGNLRTARGPVSPIYSDFPEFLAKQVTWVDCSDQGAQSHESKQPEADSYVNAAEADAILGMLRALAERRTPLRNLAKLGGTGAPIGVICMYAAQRDLVRRRLDQADWAVELRRMLQVGTVDSYQGKENRIVLVSLVRSNNSGECGFLRRPERINVAISRAMDRLVIVGAAHMWRERRGLPLFKVLNEVRGMQERGTAAIVPSREIG